MSTSFFSFAILKSFEFLTVIFKKKAVPQTVVGYEITRLSKMQHIDFICLFIFRVDQFEGPID